MTTSENGVMFICSFEGFRAAPYPDPASGGEPITIGYGTTHYTDGAKVTMADAMVTPIQGRSFVAADLVPVDRWLTTNVPNLNQNQHDALASFCYNEGLHNFETSTLLKDVEAGAGSGNIVRDFEMWTKASGRVMKGLQTRRDAEAKLFETPVA